MLAFLPASLKEWARVLLVALIVFGVTYPVARCDGVRDERSAGVARLEKANRAFLEMKARADELAANQRLTDTVAVNRQEQELRNVVAQTPDSLPDASRIALGCERLRRAHGAGSAALPAVCRPGGGAQAGPAS